VTEPTSEQIRTALERATDDAPAPHPWAEVERRAGDAGAPASSLPRPGMWLAAAACVVALIAGLAIIAGFGDDEIRQDDRPSIVPSTTTAPTTPPTSTVDESPTVTAESTTTPPTSTVPPGSEQPPVLPRPVSGQTQRSVVGDITWTLLEGDASTVPQWPFTEVDGAYLGGVYEGRTWRSSDGLEWELVDLGGDGVADESVFGEFDFRGETWARTNDGLARWDGQTFVPVALPESPFVDLDGLTSAGRIVGAPVVLGDELVVPATTFLRVPWDAIFVDGARAEWAGDPQSIRIVDTNPMDGPLPVLAILSAEFVQGESGRFEFRDVESNELVTTVEVIPGVEPADFLARVVDGLHREVLIGDADGFEAVDPPGGWGVPGDLTGDIVPIDGGVLGIAHRGYRTLTSRGDELDAEGWEVWTSSDARSWTRLELPTPSGSIIDIVETASDGSTAILTIYSRLNGFAPQHVESWITDDGSRWEEIDVGDGTAFSGFEPAEFGWLVGDDHIDIAVSPDGRTWQEVRFGFPEDSGGGTSVVGRTIFVNNWLADSTTTLWVGTVEDG
jgi:hypothetical protein